MQIDVSPVTTAIGDAQVAVALILMALIGAFALFYAYSIVITYLKEECGYVQDGWGVSDPNNPNNYPQDPFTEYYYDADDYDSELSAEGDYQTSDYEHLNYDDRLEYWRSRGFNEDDARSRADAM